jgi:hypothetical protein
VPERRHGVTGIGCFALLALVTELTGRSVTVTLDRMFHVVPLTTPVASYYPFLLAGIRVAAASALAAVAWRLVRAYASVAAGELLLQSDRHQTGVPRLRLRLTPKRWLVSFGATSLWFLLQNDYERMSHGRWPLLGPWLHTYALPVFAVLAVLLALGWALVGDWLAEVEQYAAARLSQVCRVLRAGAQTTGRQRSGDDRAPRHLFGLVFESRPPPLAA